MTSSVICLGTDWYQPIKSSTSQVIDCFYRRGMKVLWINPVPIRFPSTKRSDFWSRVQSKAQTHARLLSTPQKNMYVYSPVFLPGFSETAMQFNRMIITAQVAALCQILRMSTPLFFFSTYTAWYALPLLKHAPSVFHFADKISAFRETSSNPYRRRILDTMETQLIRAASLITCSSRSIYKHAFQKVGDQTEKVLYLPHGVNASRFRAILEGNVAMPTDLKDISKPIAGYFGTLTETNDKATFAYAAQRCPDWSFVFIGKVAGDYTELACFKNVFFLGQKPYEEIPIYGKFFDVCFMGWLPHEWITNCSPIKTLEYLALGKPVVCSSYIEELDKYAPLVQVTRTPEEYVTALRKAYEQNNPALVQARLEFVRQYTWDAHADTILQFLNSRRDDP
jgi:glycosyltransferase involved in cell wall biosynthesis